MNKELLVSSELQATLLNGFLLNEIQNGFWVGQRPATHGLAWNGVTIRVSDTNTVGPQGFKSPRFYDFLNPEFTKKHEEALVNLARTVKPNMTFKALKKELIELARIIGGRMTDKTQEPARVYRGNNRTDYAVIRSVNRTPVLTAPSDTKSTPIQTKKLTAVKKVKPTEEGVVITKTSSGATVRRVPVQSVAKV